MGICEPRKRWGCLGISMVAGLWMISVPGQAIAFTVQATDNTHKICQAATLHQERLQRIPRRLLGAISITETGRWDKVNRVSVAWPWTVTSGGQGIHFNSKAEAIAEVELLLTEGIRNIDVGCMQINLFYHGEAFETLEEAFDPDLNAAYAGKFLKEKFSETKNWVKAVGNYHSKTPKKSQYYAGKVTKIWKQQKNQPYQIASLKNNTQRTVKAPIKETESKQFNLFAQSSTSNPVFQIVDTSELELEEDFNPEAINQLGAIQSSNSVPLQIDTSRMHDLNAAFKKRRTRERLNGGNGSTGMESAADRRKSDLDQWRNNISNGLNMSSVSAIRAAEIARKKQEKLNKLLNSETDFADHRQDQLKLWKKRTLFPGT